MVRDGVRLTPEGGRKSEKRLSKSPRSPTNDASPPSSSPRSPHSPVAAPRSPEPLKSPTNRGSLQLNRQRQSSSVVSTRDVRNSVGGPTTTATLQLQLKELLEAQAVADAEDVEFEFAASAGELPIIPAMRRVPEADLPLLPVFRIALPSDVFQIESGKAGSNSFEEFLKLAVGRQQVLEKPAEGCKYWIVGGNGYLAYVAVSATELTLSLLMDHLADSTSDCQQLGSSIELALQLVLFGMARAAPTAVSATSPTAPVAANSSASASSQPLKMSRKSATGDTQVQSPPHDSAQLSLQMRELTLAICKYAADTNAKLAKIEAATCSPRP